MRVRGRLLGRGCGRTGSRPSAWCPAGRGSRSRQLGPRVCRKGLRFSPRPEQKGSGAWSRARQPLWKQPEPRSAVVDPWAGPAVGTRLGLPR